MVNYKVDSEPVWNDYFQQVKKCLLKTDDLNSICVILNSYVFCFKKWNKVKRLFNNARTVQKFKELGKCSSFIEYEKRFIDGHYVITNALALDRHIFCIISRYGCCNIIKKGNLFLINNQDLKQYYAKIKFTGIEIYSPNNQLLLKIDNSKKMICKNYSDYLFNVEKGGFYFEVYHRKNNDQRIADIAYNYVSTNYMQMMGAVLSVYDECEIEMLYLLSAVLMHTKIQSHLSTLYAINQFFN